MTFGRLHSHKSNTGIQSFTVDTRFFPLHPAATLIGFILYETYITQGNF